MQTIETTTLGSLAGLQNLKQLPQRVEFLSVHGPLEIALGVADRYTMDRRRFTHDKAISFKRILGPEEFMTRTY